jgi:hypothetical protein
MNVSFIIATLGPSLERTLQSIETYPVDEILIVSDARVDMAAYPAAQRPGVRFLHHPPGGDWGHSERNFAMPLAAGDFLSFMDDDDYYSLGHRAAMEEAMLDNPNGPTIFSMRLHHMGNYVLWRDTEIRCGNVGTPMFFVPRDVSKLGTWPPYYGGDCTFMQSCKWDSVRWSRQIIAEVTGNSL